MNVIRRINSLDVFFKTAIYSLLATLLIFLILIPLIPFGYIEIPLGITLGSLVSVIFYFLIGLFNKRNPITKRGMTPIVIIISLRFIVLGAMLTLVGLLYFKFHVYLFNIFAVAGGYIIPLVVLLIINLKERS